MTSALETLKQAFAAFDVDDNERTVLQKSRDFYWYSPILKELLKDVRADLVVAPRNEQELIDILSICYRQGTPVTVRGAGTGNYGQAMPLQGGVVLHMKHMDKVLQLGDDFLTAQAGAIMADVEKTAREAGREIRLFPSTTATATLGGFIAGGSSGVGAIRWGGLRNVSNIRRVRLVTLEETPRVIELTGEDIYRAAHAYGVNGVLTEIEIPIDPAGDWIDVLIGTSDFTSAMKLAFSIGRNDTIDKRMLSTFEAPIPDRYFTRHKPFLIEGEAMVAAMVSRESLVALEANVAASPDAAIRFRADLDGEGMRLPPAYELAWNHTTLRALKVDPSITYLQMMLPQHDIYDAIERLKAAFGDEIQLHCEFTRFGGQVAAVTLPLVRFSNAERLEELIDLLETEHGVTVFNPHRVTLEEGGMKKTDQAQLEFKRQTDPKGLMNPGKMIAWTHPDWKPESGRIFLFNR